MLLAGIAVVALVAVGIILLISRAGDDSAADSTPSVSGEAVPTSPAVIAPADTAAATEGSAPDCAEYVYVPTDDGTLAVIDTASNAVVNTFRGGLWVINTATDAVGEMITLDGRPDGIALSPDGATAYVADRAGALMWVLDTPMRTVRTTVEVGEYPAGVAVTPDGGTLYVSTE